MKIVFSLIFLAMCFVLPSQAQATPATVAYGGKLLFVPVPDDCINVYGLSKEYDAFWDATASKYNRMLAVVVLKKELKQVVEGKRERFTEYYSVQYPKVTEQEVLSPQQFRGISQGFLNSARENYERNRNVMEKTFNESIESAQDTLGTDKFKDLSYQGTRLIDVLRDEALQSLTVNLLTVNGASKGKKLEMYVGAGCLLIQGKLLYLYYYQSDADSHDPEQVGQRFMRIADEMFRVNQ